ncbi:MAG: glutamine amidophosphoribosyltransferase [Arcobacter sp.]|nr:glutamine amidophosphoribosyltransferase [Arcobacter sp.]|tara:strand:+ start:2206 stop:3408 length:1203 start_codon:yes stop_codon:yes gene_type:complete
MKYEKLLIDKLHDNIGSSVLIGKNDLLSTKLEKYLKRYMGKSIRLNYETVELNSVENLRNYFMFIAPRNVIFIVNETDTTKINKYFLEVLISLKIEIIIISNLKSKIINSFRDYKVKIYQIPKVYGFNEELDKIEKSCCDNNEFNENIILVDEVASKIAQAIADNKFDDLELILLKNKYKKEEMFKIAEKQKNCSLRLLYKGETNDYILGRNVGDFRINLGITLSEKINKEVLSKIDYIVPVPSSGIFYAVGLSKALKIPFLPALKKLEISERAFEIQDVDMRKSYLSKNMEVNAHLIKGKKLLIVDEAIFTGATLKIVCDLLKENGANEVHIAIPSPKCYKNCEYLVQPERVMLLNKINENGISRYFDVESITYMELEDYEKELKSIDNICLECFHRLQ